MKQEVSVQEAEQVNVEPAPEYSEPVWEEPVQEVQSYSDGSVAATYNGQYPGTCCEGVAGCILVGI